MPNATGKIAYVVSHGFAARMLLQTGLLGKLRALGREVCIIPPDDSDPVLREYCNLHGIGLHPFSSGKWIWKTNYGLYRSYFLEDLRSNAALYEKHYYEVHLRQGKLIFRIIPRILMMIQAVFTRVPAFQKAFGAAEQLLLRDRRALRLLKELRAGLVVSTYPVNAREGILLHNARIGKIPTAIHLLSWDNITCKGRFYSLADRYIAWGPVMVDEFISHYGIPEKCVEACGVPHFDLHHQMQNDPERIELIRKTGMDPSKPYLVFGMSSPRFAPREIDIVEHLASGIQSGLWGPDFQMLVRPHPQNVMGWMADPGWLQRLKKLESPRIRIFYPLLAKSHLPWSMEHEDMRLLSAALSGCLVCINSCSTLSIDALMSGKGNIAPMFDGQEALPYWQSARRLLDYTHIRKFVASGGTEVAVSYEDLQNKVNSYLEEPETHYTAACAARQSACGPASGEATDRVAVTIDKWLAEFEEPSLGRNAIRSEA